MQYGWCYCLLRCRSISLTPKLLKLDGLASFHLIELVSERGYDSGNPFSGTCLVLAFDWWSHWLISALIHNCTPLDPGSLQKIVWSDNSNLHERIIHYFFLYDDLANYQQGAQGLMHSGHQSGSQELDGWSSWMIVGLTIASFRLREHAITWQSRSYGAKGESYNYMPQ